MKRKRLFIIVICLLMGTPIVGAMLMYQLRDRGPVPLHRFNEIHDGMTRGDVQALLGCPPGNYATRKVIYRRVGDDGNITLGQFAQNWDGSGFENESFWASDHGLISVTFDKNGAVCDKALWQSRRVGWLLILEDRLGLLR